jgi:hypothetical protein
MPSGKTDAKSGHDPQLHKLRSTAPEPFLRCIAPAQCFVLTELRDELHDFRLGALGSDCHIPQAEAPMCGEGDELVAKLVNAPLAAERPQELHFFGFKAWN